MLKPIDIPIKIHPRALSAFGEDLITNDNIAIIELVKNSYDAYALKTEIIFGSDEQGKSYIEIKDDGCGMTREIIESAWATIATSYKKSKPFITRRFTSIDSNGNEHTEERTRIVSGNKGLGRFSAARLGHEMCIVTKHRDDECISAYFDWRSFDEATAISDCRISLSYQTENVFADNVNGTGTSIIIKALRSEWKEDEINALISELSRLINPFENLSDFSITLKSRYFDDAIEIKPHSFINRPIYKISGQVNDSGEVSWVYANDTGDKTRKSEGIIQWNQENYGKIALQKYACGKFSFEIRAWDLDPESISSLHGRFNIEKRQIRNYISQYKGLSVYRDNVLVLPKSESARDWLGLDAKRISKVGDRLSTSQIVGIINISNENNPGIKDTTDREKLADTPEYRQFENVILSIISTLQNERTSDRTTQTPKTTLTDIIAPLSSKALVEDVERAIDEGQPTEQILSYVQKYDAQNEDQLNKLNDRLVYYAQTASLGSVASVIMHEILTGMTTIKRFLNKAQNYNDYYDDRTRKYLDDANTSHKRLLDVTASFSPLYRRDLRKKDNYCNLLECVRKSIRLIKAKKISCDIKFLYDIDQNIVVQMAEGELQTVLINFFDNACYWIKESKNSDKRIVVSVKKLENGRIEITVSDTGTGVSAENAEKIFVPGVTGKPKGIGMGLVIVTELVNAYHGKVGLKIPGDMSGASFVFDLPLRKG